MHAALASAWRRVGSCLPVTTILAGRFSSCSWGRRRCMPIRATAPFPKPPLTFRDGNGRRATIEEYRALQGMPRGDEALRLLRSVGEAVKPIMIKHQWSLPLLVEIFPKQERLLGFNVNAGRKIALRLRRAGKTDSFLDMDSIVETMLHELAHNLRGPHDDIFFTHLDTLTREWYELQRSPSYSLPGQIFIASEGHRLGGTGGVARGSARQKAVEMAERRKRMAEQMAAAARSGASRVPSSPAAASAEAAERRRLITNSCPTSSVEDTQAAAEEQQEHELLHGIQVITIDDDDDDGFSLQEAAGRQAPDVERDGRAEENRDDDDDVVVLDVRRAQPRASSSHLISQTHAAAALRHDLLAGSYEEQPAQGPLAYSSSSEVTHSSASWNCQRCTLLNPAPSLVCQACDDTRPGLPHWTCSHCRHRMLGDFAQYWCCSGCSRVKMA